MRKNLLMGLALMLMIVFQAFGQTDVTISGRLVDKDGQPVPGANVYVKGTKVGTVTDADGNYTITVPQGSVLTFAAAGFTERTVKVANQTVINLTMEEEQIEAITVTSYGQVIDKTTTTGAITAVSGKDFENLPLQSFDRAMQGRLAGVAVNASSGAPGGGLTVRIRGTGSVLASNAPLYIVDGVQVNPGAFSTQAGATGTVTGTNALASINPNDIETIEVLKDPASAAIYGAQSANGVVIITTKKGKKNSDQFTVTMQEGFVEPIRLYNVLRARDYALLKQEAAVNDLFVIGNPPPTQAQIDAAIANARRTYGSPDTTVDFNWKKAVFRIARIRMYDINYSGGTDKTRFYISAAYQRQEGTIIKNFWERVNARFNIDHRPNRRFTIQTSNNISNQNIFGFIAGGEGNFLNSPFMTGFLSAPTYSAYLPDGRFAEYTTGVLPFNYNLLQGLEYERRTGNAVQIVSSIKATYNFLPELSITGFAGVDWLNN
ncbi:MAG: TonB-dependent receptor plug domain-containing protein, partial [Raineya sp.]|nr:TonB-dependent receptor plug domain-containing protein [Raineya sp.]